MDGVAGRLLVATPDLLDPSFYRSVVLVCSHDDEGAFGLILNRPLDAAVADHIDEWSEHVVGPPVVFEGGPVQRTTAVGLALGPANREWNIQIGPGLGLIDLAEDPATVELRALRVFSGYADGAQASWMPRSPRRGGLRSIAGPKTRSRSIQSSSGGACCYDRAAISPSTRTSPTIRYPTD